MAPPRRPWFRFYTEAASDRKLRRLTPAERWLWTMVLSAARESPVAGVLLLTETEPMTVEDIAEYAGMKEREVKAGLRKMADPLDLVYERSDGALVVTKWHDRQYESDDVAARTRKSRSNGKQPDDDPPSMERSIDVPGNTDRTAMERSREHRKDVPGNVDGTRPENRNQKTDVSQSSPVKPTGRAGAGLDDDDPVLSLLTSAAAILGRRDCDRAIADGIVVVVPAKYRESCIEKRCASADLAALAVANPSVTPRELADLADGPTTARPALALVPAMPVTDPDCERCGGDGVRPVDDTGNTMVDCECKLRGTA